MDKIKLKKFIEDYNIEWRYQDNEDRRTVNDVLIFVYTFQADAFYKLLTSFDDEIECTLVNGYFCFWMKDICSYYGIKLNEIFIQDHNGLD